MGFSNWEVDAAGAAVAVAVASWRSCKLESYIAPESLLQDGGLAGACVAAVASPPPKMNVCRCGFCFFFLFFVFCALPAVLLSGLVFCM